MKSQIWYRFPWLTPLVLSINNMLQRPIRTVLTCLGVVLGVGVILAINITNYSTLESFRQIFDETAGRSHLMVTADSTFKTGIDPKIMGKVRSIDGVVLVCPSVIATTMLGEDVTGWEPSVGMGGKGVRSDSLQVVGVDPQVDQELRLYSIEEGHWLKGEKNEVIISRNLATQKDLHLHDSLSIVTSTGLEDMRIAGILSNTGAGLMNNGNVLFISLDAGQYLFQRGDNFDALDVMVDAKIAETPQQLEEIRLQIQEKVGESYKVEYPASRGQVVSQLLLIYQSGLAFFSLMAVFIGSFIIYNSFSMTVLERTSEIGMLRAIGIDRNQVFMFVLIEAGLLGVVGSLGGVAFGIWLGRTLTGLMSGLVALKIQSMTFTTDGLLQSLMVGCGVTLVAALLPAYRAANISPMAAIIQKTSSIKRKTSKYLFVGAVGLIIIAFLLVSRIPQNLAAGFKIGSVSIVTLLMAAILFIPLTIIGMERYSRQFLRLLYHCAGELGSRNIQRSFGRTVLTIAALMSSITLIIGIGTVTASFKTDLNQWVKSAIGGDLQVISPKPLPNQFTANLLRTPGVKAVSGRLQFDVRASRSSFTHDGDGTDVVFRFNAIDPNTYRDVSTMQFSKYLTDSSPHREQDEVIWDRFSLGDTVFVSTAVSEKYGINPGDELLLITSKGEKTFFVLAVVVDFSPQGNVIFGSTQDARRFYGKTQCDRFIVSVEPDHDPDIVKRDIEERFQDRYDLVVLSSMVYQKRVLDLAQEAFELMDVLSMIGVIISALGVANTLMMNVIERQREIGALRSIGMTQSQVLAMILAESGSMGMVGGFYGLLVGGIIAKIMIYILNSIGGYALTASPAILSYLWGITISLLVTHIAAIIPAWKASRTNIVYAITHE